MSHVDKIGDVFLRCSGWMAVEFPLGVPASHFISRSLELAYGLMTGTEFSGSRIDRTLAGQWHKAINQRLCDIDDIDMPRGDYRTQLFFKRLGLSIQQQNEIDARNYLHHAMLEQAAHLMEAGVSRREAQRRVVETCKVSV